MPGLLRFIFACVSDLGKNTVRNMLIKTVLRLFCSLKMPTVWRSLLQRSCANIILRILVLSAELGGSITFMAHLEHGKVDPNARNGYV